MDKFELKEKLIELMSELDKIESTLMSKGCNDTETGNIRARVLRQVAKTRETFREEIYNIY